MNSRITKQWVLLSAVIFPLTSVIPFLLLRGLFAKLFHLFIPLWMVAFRAYWSARKKREALKLKKGQVADIYLKRYDLLDQLSLVFLFFFEYALLLGVTVYARSHGNDEEFWVATGFLFGCVVLYISHVVLRVKAYGKLESYINFNAPDRPELSGFTTINRLDVKHSMY